MESNQPGVLPFEQVQLVLIDIHHQIVQVNMGAMFQLKRPGHVFYCELARIAHARYSIIRQFYAEEKFRELLDMHVAIKHFLTADRTPFKIPDIGQHEREMVEITTPLRRSIFTVCSFLPSLSSQCCLLSASAMAYG